jgi:hypothetical protein
MREIYTDILLFGYFLRTRMGFALATVLFNQKFCHFIFSHDSILLRFRRFVSLRFKRPVIWAMALRTHPRVFNPWCPGPVTAYTCEGGEF